MSLEITKQKLTEYKTLIDQDVTLISRRIYKQTEEVYGQYSGDVVKAYLDILSRGGKRLRGALTMHAYFMAGGDDDRVAVRAATCIEMLHAYLLVVDDIADHSRLRRGKAAAQVMLEQYHLERGYKGDAVHFAKSQATNAALAGAHLAMKEICQLEVKDAYKLSALRLINEAMLTTTQGQINDIMNGVVLQISERDVRQVLVWKTAYYTFLNPLEFGMALAGTSLENAEWLRDYAVHAGTSFQLTDDIIGVYGTDGETGKSNLDDLREGKMTLLMARALDKANDAQKRTLLNMLGRQDIDENDREAAMTILDDTGAYLYVTELAEREGQLAMEALDNAESVWGSDLPFLRGIVEYVRSRNS